MKKLHFLAIFILLASCQDNINEVISEVETNNDLLESQYIKLEFSDRNEIRAAIEDDNYDLSTATRNNGFISMLSNHPTTRNSDTNEQMTYYEASGFEELVPNKNFAKLLNPNGEVIVNDTVFYINSNGTYYFQKSLEEEFKSIYAVDSLGTEIAKDLYRLADGIYRYNSFIESEVEEIEIELTYGEYNIWEEEDDDEISTIAIPELNYSSFPTFKA